MNLYTNAPVEEHPVEVKRAANAIGWALEQVCKLTLHPDASMAAARNLHDQNLLRPVLEEARPFMAGPPLSPEETTTPEIFALATRIGIEMARLKKPLSEMEAIGVAEVLTGEGDPRTAFCDELEAPGTPLCDCEPRSQENPATSPRTGEPMDHHCECRAVLASQVLRKGRKTLHGNACHCEDRS